MTTQDISYNFSVAKVLAILMVVTGHYFTNTILWVPTTIALFVFGFSSGYFTSRKYTVGFSILAFWDAKIVRMGYELVVINMFLLMLFLMQHRNGIFTWQTLPSMLGLDGFFNWMHIQSPSPFGAGLWFFTVLWIFYLIYPLLARINQSQKRAALFTIAVLISSTWLNYTVAVGHELWLTIFAFVFGGYVGRFHLNLSPIILMLLLLGCMSGMIALNLYWHINMLNPIFLVLCSLLTVLILLNQKLPVVILNKTLILSGCMMEIYFIHSYLLIHNDKYPDIEGYLLSLGIIIPLALLLRAISNCLKMMLNGHACWVKQR